MRERLPSAVCAVIAAAWLPGGSLHCRAALPATARKENVWIPYPLGKSNLPGGEAAARAPPSPARTPASLHRLL